MAWESSSQILPQKTAIVPDRHLFRLQFDTGAALSAARCNQNSRPECWPSHNPEKTSKRKPAVIHSVRQAWQPAYNPATPTNSRSPLHPAHVIFRKPCLPRDVIVDILFHFIATSIVTFVAPRDLFHGAAGHFCARDGISLQGWLMLDG